MVFDGHTIQSQNNQPIEFFGEIGVAGTGPLRALDQTDRRWVSACILSRVNDNNVTVAISIRGPHAILASTPCRASAIQ